MNLLCSALALFLLGDSPPQDWVARTSLTKTPAGREIDVLRIAKPGGNPDERPGLLIVAGIDGRDEFGPWLAKGLVEWLGSERPEALSEVTLYVIPRLNPDGAKQFSEGSPRIEFGGRVRATDADLDRREGEDGGEDLDGDGRITTMRIADPPLHSGLTARYVLDDHDPRALRLADEKKDEVARYALVVEGLDDDGDGKWNEDGRGGSEGTGVSLDQDFPALWQALVDGTEAWPLWQPESKALADWLLARPNVLAVLTYGAHDNLAKLPEVGKFDATKRMPLGIEEGDKTFYEAIGETYRELTGIEKSTPVDRGGSFHHWAYAHLGLVSFATPGWARSDQIKKEKSEKGEDESGGPKDGVQEGPTSLTPASALKPTPAEQAPASGEAKGTSSKKKGEKSEDVLWLEASDARRGDGFVEWKAFDHPQLGPVEIGGFVPGFRSNPPSEQWEGWRDKQRPFVLELLSRFPRLNVGKATATRLLPGLWRVSVRCENQGAFATRSAMGVKMRRLPGVVCVLEAEADQIIAGSKVQQVARLLAGEHQDLQWTVRAEDGSKLSITVRSAEFGNREIQLSLKESK